MKKEDNLITDFNILYDNYKVDYKKYLLYTLVGGFWGLNKLLLKDYKTTYERSKYASCYVLMLIVFFYLYYPLAELICLISPLNTVSIERFKYLLFSFFLPIFMIIISIFICYFIQDLIGSRNAVNKYNHKLKKYILKNKDKLNILDELKNKDEQIYKTLYNNGAIFGIHNEYWGSKGKRLISMICPTLISLIIYYFLISIIFSVLFSLLNLVTPNTISTKLFLSNKIIYEIVPTFLNIIPIWFIINLILTLVDYKKMKKIKIKKPLI